MKFTKLDYCQYLLSSQINYTLTNLAEHLENISHDKINSYLKNEKEGYYTRDCKLNKLRLF
jgi:hypothetical protein